MADHSWWGWGDAAQVPELPDAVLRAAARRPRGERAAIAEPGDAGRSRGVAAGADAAAAARRGGRRGARDRRAMRRVWPHAREVDGGPAASPGRRRHATRPTPWCSRGRHEEVLEVLRICAEERIAVVPFGGGTSVVGGLAPAAEGFAGGGGARPAADERAVGSWTRSRAWPSSGRGCAGPRPRRCWRSAGTRSATSRSRSSTPRGRVRGDALERPGLRRLRPVRRARGGAAGGDAGGHARAGAGAEARRAGRTSGSWCWARRARSG